MGNRTNSGTGRMTVDNRQKNERSRSGNPYFSHVKAGKHAGTVYNFKRKSRIRKSLMRLPILLNDSTNAYIDVSDLPQHQVAHLQALARDLRDLNVKKACEKTFVFHTPFCLSIVFKPSYDSVSPAAASMTDSNRAIIPAFFAII